MHLDSFYCTRFRPLSHLHIVIVIVIVTVVVVAGIRIAVLCAGTKQTYSPGRHRLPSYRLPHAQRSPSPQNLIDPQHPTNVRQTKRPKNILRNHSPASCEDPKPPFVTSALAAVEGQSVHRDWQWQSDGNWVRSHFFFSYFH